MTKQADRNKKIIVGSKEWLKKQRANCVPNSDENVFSFRKVTREEQKPLGWNQGYKVILVGIWLTIKEWLSNYKKGMFSEKIQKAKEHIKANR